MASFQKYDYVTARPIVGLKNKSCHAVCSVLSWLVRAKCFFPVFYVFAQNLKCTAISVYIHH